jgi:hypothetical protein
MLLSIDPCSCMLSSNVLIISWSVYETYSSATNDSLLTKICTAVTPLWTDEASLKTVSIEKVSLHRFILRAGNQERKCCFRVLETFLQAYYLVTLNVCIASMASQPNNSKFGFALAISVSLTLYTTLTLSGYKESLKSSVR